MSQVRIHSIFLSLLHNVIPKSVPVSDMSKAVQASKEEVVPENGNVTKESKSNGMLYFLITCRHSLYYVSIIF